MIAGVLGTIATLLVLLKIIAPANYQDDISAFILKLVGIEAVAGDCGGGKKRTPCAITLVMALMRVVPKIIDKLLFCDRNILFGLGTWSALCAPGTLINILLDCIEGYISQPPSQFLGELALLWTWFTPPPAKSSISPDFVTLSSTSRTPSRRSSIVPSTKTRTFVRPVRPSQR